LGDRFSVRLEQAVVAAAKDFGEEIGCHV
jgi:hypothetical protein